LQPKLHRNRCSIGHDGPQPESVGGGEQLVRDGQANGLRASEVCDLQWQQIELSEGRLQDGNAMPKNWSEKPLSCCQAGRASRDYPSEPTVMHLQIVQAGE
jgi:hypothetical protein